MGRFFSHSLLFSRRQTLSRQILDKAPLRLNIPLPLEVLIIL